MAWAPDGKQLIAAGDDQWTVFNRDGWTVQAEHPLFRGGRAVAYSPDGEQIAIANGDRVAIWDTQGQQIVTQLSGHTSSINSVSWAPDDHQLVTAADDGEIKLWDLSSRLQPAPVTVNEPPGSISWLQDNDTVSVASASRETVFEWRVADGELQTKSIGIERPASLGPSRRFAAMHSEDKNEIAIIQVKDGESYAMLKLAPNHNLRFVAFSPDDSKLCTATSVGTEHFVSFWDIETERLIAEWSLKAESGANPSGIYWSHDGTKVALIARGDIGDDGSPYWKDHVHVIDANSGQRRLKYRGFSADVGRVACMAWSQDDTSFALGSDDGRIEAFDLERQRILFEKKVHNLGFTSLAWSQQGDRLACGADDGTVLLVAVEAARPVLTLTLPDKSSTLVAWSGDGKRLAAATKQGEIHVFDATRGFAFSSGGPRRGEAAWHYLARGLSRSDERGTLSLRQALSLAPDKHGFWEMRGEAYVMLGAFDEAGNEFSKLTSKDVSTSFGSTHYLMLCLLGNRDFVQYREKCSQLADQFRETPVPSNKAHLAWLCALSPNALSDTTTPLALARDGYHSTNNDRSDTIRLTLAACLFRDDQLDEAARMLGDLTYKLNRGGDTADRYELACARYFLAMTRNDLGDHHQANRLLALANESAAELPPSLGNWRGRVILGTLRHEAETRIRHSP